MADGRAKKKIAAEDLPIWKQPMPVRPEIMAAFQRWQSDPDSVYARSGPVIQTGPTSGAPAERGSVPAFVIPSRTVLRAQKEVGIHPEHPSSPFVANTKTVDEDRQVALMPPKEPLTQEDLKSSRLSWMRRKLVRMSPEVDRRSDEDRRAPIAQVLSPVSVLVPQLSQLSQLRPLRHGVPTTEHVGPYEQKSVHKIAGLRMTCKSPPMSPLLGAARTRRPAEMPIGKLSGDSADLRLVRLSVIYLPDTRRILVKDIACDSLSDGPLPTNQFNPFLRLHMTSSDDVATTMTRTTMVLMATNEPKFDDLICFDGFTRDRLAGLSLEIEICSKIEAHPDSAHRVIGGAVFSLNNIETGSENHLIEIIQDVLAEDQVKDDMYPANALCIEICFKAKEGELILIVERASALSPANEQHVLDSYVKIVLDQPGKTVNKARTLIQKKCSDPIFEEKFVFNMSPKIDDLRYTSMTVSVRQRRKMRSDKKVGLVRFGAGSTEESEMEHWQIVLQNPGISYKRWHKLFDIK